MRNASGEGNQVKCIKCYSNYLLCMSIFVTNTKVVQKLVKDRYIDTQRKSGFSFAEFLRYIFLVL